MSLKKKNQPKKNPSLIVLKRMLKAASIAAQMNPEDSKFLL